jgi:hypothetical protein
VALSARVPSNRLLGGRLELLDRQTIGEWEVLGAGRLGEGLGHPGRGLAGRRSQGNAQRPVRQIDEDGQQARQRGRLAGARSPGDHRGPPVRRVERRRPLFGVRLASEEPAQCRIEPSLVDHGSATGNPGQQVLDDIAFLVPVPIQVEQSRLDPQGGAAERAPRDRSQPVRGLGPGPLRIQLGDPGQIQAHRALAHGADQQRDREDDPGIRLSAEPGDPGRDVDVGRGQDSGTVEIGQVSGGAECEAVVQGIDRLEQLTHAAPTSPSRRSERASTRATGGLHEKTPHGCPSSPRWVSSGVCAPHIPRT